eukprot:scaffold20962_cov112-Isochrysis_galbana.AAC.10
MSACMVAQECRTEARFGPGLSKTAIKDKKEGGPGTYYSALPRSRGIAIAYLLEYPPHSPRASSLIIIHQRREFGVTGQCTARVACCRREHGGCGPSGFELQLLPGDKLWLARPWRAPTVTPLELGNHSLEAGPEVDILVQGKPPGRHWL